VGNPEASACPLKRGGVTFAKAHVWTHCRAGKRAIAEWFYMAAASDDPMPPVCNIVLSTIQHVIRQGRDTGAREPVGITLGPGRFRGLFSANAVARSRYRCLAYSGVLGS
jgi:hypothetical protein